LPLDLTEQLMD